jgi:TIR domain
MKTKLFVSYASEDTAFAQSLADQLQAADFEVWFAPYTLTIGDSLLRKISQGLSECDYGIVILSPSFFSKEWPQHELDGLFSLEEARSKVILPVWKDVTREEVARYSPILAGRLAAQASRGLSAVFAEIRAAIAAGNRVASFSPENTLSARFRSLEEKEAHRQRAEALRRSTEGLHLVQASAVALMAKLEKQITEFQAEASRFKLAVKRDPHSITVSVAGPIASSSFSCSVPNFRKRLPKPVST